MTAGDRSWGTNPPIGPLTSAAAAARQEWREEQEAATAEAAEAYQHSRTVADLLNESMRRGDRVAVSVGPHRGVGQIVEVAADLVAVRNLGSGRIDFQLRAEMPWQLVVQEQAVSQPAGDELPSGSFRARLLDREAAGGEATIGSVLSAEPIDGRLVVGTDHVRVIGRGGGETLVPVSALAFVGPRRD